jgi:hypothetical protein
LQVNSLSEGRLSATYSALAAVPTAGKYAAGDFVRNSVPVVTGTAPNTYVVWGWVCTVGGEPGTFEAINIPTGTFGPGLLALDDLSDVAISAPVFGEVLKYTGSQWINDTISGAGASWTETEIDFGAAPVYEAVFTLTDASITAASKVQVLPCGKAATGRTADDWAWDGATFAALPASGSATCYAHFMPGPIVGRRKVQYSVGA